MKSQRRCQIREEFTYASAEVLAERLAQARAEEKRLLPLHSLTQEEAEDQAFACRETEVSEGIHLGVRMPPRSDKHAKFGDLAPKRQEGVLEAIHKLANLSSPNYDFEGAEVEKIFKTIQERVEEARGRFLRRLTKRARFTL